jgi:hypothetical protein
LADGSRDRDLGHVRGQFFSVHGLEVTIDQRTTPVRHQPIIVQAEIGILGMLVKVVAANRCVPTHPGSKPGTGSR